MLKNQILKFILCCKHQDNSVKSDLHLIKLNTWIRIHITKTIKSEHPNEIAFYIFRQTIFT